MRVIKEFRNDILKRNEVIAVLEADSNPGYDSVSKKLAEKFKASEDSIVIKTLKGKFGTHTFTVEAIVYDSPHLKDATEQKKKIKEAKK